MGAVIGIDLGTTNSCAAVIEGGRATVIPAAEGDRTTPSVVAFTKNGERLVGTLAARQAAMNPTGTVSSVKREMGTRWTFAAEGRTFTAQEISAMILRKLRTDAEAYLGEPVNDAVITVPAYFDDVQRQATKDAGRIAGLNVLRIINEPTAAALAYGLDNGEPQKVMVYDLGGGTFDVSIIQIGDDIIEVLSTAGDNHLGGDDFDERLADWITEQFLSGSGRGATIDPQGAQRIREAAEQAKKELSSLGVTTVSLPFIAQGPDGPAHLEVEVTRSQFERLVGDLIDRTTIPVQRALDDAGITAAELGQVLLVGGSTRIPAVAEHVKRLTGKIPSNSVNPDECVACGAAIQAATLANALAIRDGGPGVDAPGSQILLLDVTPLTLSLETLGGVATPIIPRNTTLPAHYSQIFTTASPFQTQVEVNVLQGERPMAIDNKSIGKFRLKGIKVSDMSPKIEVTFDIDTNGILRVSAKDLKTEREQSIVIDDNDRMSDVEIEQAIRDAELYAAQDNERRGVVEVRNEAANFASQVQAALHEHSKELSPDEKRAVKNDLNNLTRALSRKAKRGQPLDSTEVAEAYERLKTSAEHLMTL